MDIAAQCPSKALLGFMKTIGLRIRQQGSSLIPFRAYRGRLSSSARARRPFTWPVPKRVLREQLPRIVVGSHRHSVTTQHTEVVEAAHPIPNAAEQIAAVRIVNLPRSLSDDDLVIALTSNGAAILPAPFGGLTLEDESETNRFRIASSIPVNAIDKVRNEPSVVKGVRLATFAHPTRVHISVVSYVASNEPATVAAPTECGWVGPQPKASRILYVSSQ